MKQKKWFSCSRVGFQQSGIFGIGAFHGDGLECGLIVMIWQWIFMFGLHFPPRQRGDV